MTGIVTNLNRAALLTACLAFKNLRAFHADPHWVTTSSTTTAQGLVDFGCAKKLSKAALQYLKGVYLCSGSRHSAEFRRLLETNYENQGKKLPRAAYRACRFCGGVPKGLPAGERD